MHFLVRLKIAGDSMERGYAGAKCLAEDAIPARHDQKALQLTIFPRSESLHET